MILKLSVEDYKKYWSNPRGNGSFTYVVLGDSAAQSIGASSPEKGYVGLIAKSIEERTGKQVRIINLSQTGAKLDDVINRQLAELEKNDSDLITVEIGSNEISNYNPTEFRKKFEIIASRLPDDALVANIPYFGGRVKSNDKAIDASRIIEEIVRKHELKLVDLQSETRSRHSIFNYAIDYFHPSDRGYRIWADAFLRKIEL